MKAWILFCVLWTGGLCFTCLDYNSNPVDWFSAYKSPRIYKSSDWKIQAGLAHFYMDVNSPVWTLSDRTMNESQQAVYETLTAVYTNKNADSMYLMYNDEPAANLSYDERGHTKGVVAFDKTSGFWLVHSVPLFPPKKSDNYGWPHTALEYGQTFLCVSFKYEELGNIATQLLYNEPTIYDSFVSPSILQDFPLLKTVIQGGKRQSPPWSSVIQMKSLNGQEFTSFAKAGKFLADLYDALVAPTLKQDLLVETWLNGGGGKLDSNCTSQYKVMKITSISLPADNLFFNETKDHSKWAISYSADPPRGKHVSRFSVLEDWTCVGDINRMHSQFTRGGGTLCLQHSSVWKAFRDSVKTFNKC